MKKHVLTSLLLLTALFATIRVEAQVRYFNPVFSDVIKTANVWYDSNYAINLLYGTVGLPPSLNGSPVFMASQFVTIYEPAGDTATKRPLIIMGHTGSYLPSYINQQTTGDRSDSAINEVARGLAKRGYVVALASYRSGWNPATTVQEVAAEQLIKATYRGMQDIRNCIRFFRSNAGTYKIDTSKIVVGGQGTGGYIALALATVDTRADIESNLKFLRGNGSPMVNMDTLGDWTGVGGIPPYNLPHSSTVSANAHMIFNYGGAMGDINWMKTSSYPMVSLHCKGDQFAPYLTGNVRVPTTGIVVIPNASGAGHVIPKADSMGINDPINRYFYVDPYTERAAQVQRKEAFEANNYFGFETSFPFEGSPWEWWDRTAAQAKTSQTYRGIPIPVNGFRVDSLSMLTNPYMSETRAKSYCDTVVNYVAPRIAVRFGLEGPLALNPFDLTAPANNANITVNEADSVTNITFSWEAQGGTVAYGFGIGSEDTVIVDEGPITTNSKTYTHREFYNLCHDAGVPDNTATIMGWQAVAIRPGLNVGIESGISILNVTLNPQTGLNKLNLANQLKVYPNPAKDRVYVELVQTGNNLSQIDLLDITGRVVKSVQVDNVKGYDLTLENLNSGVYFINITATNGQVATRQLVIN